jgi:hypothetical protein
LSLAIELAIAVANAGFQKLIFAVMTRKAARLLVAGQQAQTATVTVPCPYGLSHPNLAV